jgi:hypothetical protein
MNKRQPFKKLTSTCGLDPFLDMAVRSSYQPRSDAINVYSRPISTQKGPSNQHFYWLRRPFRFVGLVADQFIIYFWITKRSV